MNYDCKTDVAIIIVGLNASAFVKGCLESIGRAEWRGHTYEVIYMDNGSTDDTLSMIEENRFPHVKTIASPVNIGFCKGANAAARIAGSRYYFFLNDDTVVLDDAIALLIEFLDQYPQVAAVGSRLFNADLTDQWSGRRFPSAINAILGRRSALSRLLPNAKPLSDYLYKEQVQKGDPFAADWVSAAALMVRATTFHQINGFAEDYYYWHEAIFCDRIRKSNKEVFLHPRSKIVHYEGKGSGKRPYSTRRWHIINFHRGAYHCYCEHYGLSRLSPSRWLSALALGIRAAALIAANRIMALRENL